MGDRDSDSDQDDGDSFVEFGDQSDKSFDSGGLNDSVELHDAGEYDSNDDMETADPSDNSDQSYESSDGNEMRDKKLSAGKASESNKKGATSYTSKKTGSSESEPQIFDLTTLSAFLMPMRRYTQVKSITTTSKTTVTEARNNAKLNKAVKPTRPSLHKPPTRAPATPTKSSKALSEPNTPQREFARTTSTNTAKITRPNSASKVIPTRTTTTTTTTTTSKKITNFFKVSPNKFMLNEFLNEKTADEEKQLHKRGTGDSLFTTKDPKKKRQNYLPPPSATPYFKSKSPVTSEKKPMPINSSSSAEAKIKQKKEKSSQNFGVVKKPLKQEHSTNHQGIDGKHFDKLKFKEDGSCEDVESHDKFLPTEAGPIVCFFCKKTEAETTCEGHMLLETKTNIHIHFECLFSSSRGVNETITQMVVRIAGKGRRWLACSHCKKRPASLGCTVESCPRVYHYKCGMLAGGKWDPTAWMFYCKEHFKFQNKELLPTYKLLVRWPSYVKVEYLRDNVWDEILPVHRDYIARFARIEGPRKKDEEDMWPVAWESQDFTPRIEVREIGPGHWAWCSQLARGDKMQTCTRQYEVVATIDIKSDEFIGEYVGRVRYENPKTLRNPYVTSMFVPANLKFRQKMGSAFSGLCIDSSKEGNETRFINSVTRQSPPHMRQNATMDTVWCRGQLRVIIRAIHDISKGWPIVLNYDEYIGADGSRPYFDSDSETEGKEENYVPYIVNNVLIPKSIVVVPLMPAKE